MAQHQGKNTSLHEPEWKLSTYRRGSDGKIRTQRFCRICSNAGGRAHHARNPKKSAEYARRYRESNPNINKDYRLKTRFGLTREEYKNILDRQGGVCALCKSPPTPQKDLGVDHDHRTGRIRGLLCDSCNVSLGRFNDDPDLLIAAAGYIL